MTFNLNLRNLLFIIPLTLLVACSSDVEDVNSKTTNSTFEFGTIEQVAFETNASDSTWPELKDSMAVSLRTCILDRVYQQPVAGEKFQVRSNLTNKTVEADINGCISWTEKSDFNFLHDETFYEIKGEIEGKSNYRGLQTFAIAANPWSMQAFDLREADIIRKKSIVEASQLIRDDKYLDLENINVSVVSKSFYSDHTNIRFDVMLTPMIIRNGLDAGAIRSKLSRGEFNLRYFLIEKNLANDTRRVISEAKSTDKVRRDGILKSDISFQLTEAVSANSRIELGIIASANNRRSLGFDQGLIPVTKIQGAFSASELTETVMTFDQIKAFQQQKSLLFNEDEFGFVMDTIQITSGAEGGSNLSAQDNARSVDAIFSIKMVDSLVREDINYQLFNAEIIDSNGKVISNITKRTLTSTGELQFRVSIPFKSYEKQEWKQYTVKVTGLESPFLDVVKERVVYINPWIKSTDFAIDSKMGPPPEVNGDNSPEIFIDKFHYWFAGNVNDSFKLNKALDLSYKKSIVLELEPKLKTSHNFDGIDSGYKKIINGKYKIRFLVLAPKSSETDYTKIVNLDEYHTLTGDEVIVEAENGVINTRVQLPLTFSDQAFFAMKNLALVEVSPIDTESDLRTGYFVGTMTGARKEGTVGDILGTGKRLSTGNLIIAKELISRLSTVENKLEKDHMISDTFVTMSRKFNKIVDSKNDNLKKLIYPVVNSKSLKIEPKKIQIYSYNSENEFRIKHNITRTATSQITSMIDDPLNLNKEQVRVMCSVLFGQFDKTTISFHVPRQPVSKIEKVGLMFNKCLARYKDYLDVQSFYHVNKITRQPYDINVELGQLTRSVAYFTSKGENFDTSYGNRESDYWGHNLRAGVGGDMFWKIGSAPFALLGALNYGFEKGVRYESFSGDSIQHVISDQERLANQDGIVVNYDKFNVSFEADVTKCLMFNAKFITDAVPLRNVSYNKTTEVVRTFSSNKKFYVCKKNSEIQNMTESYYFMRTNLKSDMADDELAINNLYLKTLRGFANFDQMRKNQVESDQKLVFIKRKNDQVLENYNKYFNKRGKGLDYSERLDSGIPGLIEVPKKPFQ